MKKVEVNQKQNQVKLFFNKKFYDKKFIDIALNDYSKVCNIKQEGDAIILEPKEEIDLTILGCEFYNYVLGLMKNL